MNCAPIFTTMKRGIIGLGSLLFLGITAFLPPQKKNKNKKEAPGRYEVMYREVGSPLPAFRVLTTAGVFIQTIACRQTAI